jgi:hypothetical protein
MTTICLTPGEAPSTDLDESLDRRESKPQLTQRHTSHAERRQSHGLPKDRIPQFRSRRSKRHSHTKFLPALLDRIRHHRIDTNRSHKQSGQSEDRQYPHIEALAAGGVEEPRSVVTSI